MKNKIKAVIFDVDGVLLDTVPYHFNAWKKMFGEEDIVFTEDMYLKKVNGLPRNTGIKNILPLADDKKLEELASKKQKYFLEMVSKKPPLPLGGVKDALRKLKELQIRLAAASSSKNAPVLLKTSGLDVFFDVIVGGNDFVKSKPHPEIFLTAAMGLKVFPQNCVVVEDALLGIEAAKSGGMLTIGLLTSQDPNIEARADLTIPSLADHNKAFAYFNIL